MEVTKAKRPSIAPREIPLTVIRPSKGWTSPNLGDLWAYRELLYSLVWRDFKVRYKQSIFGVGWAIIRPITMMVIFSILFGRLLNAPSDGQPYPIFTYAALLPWQLFSRGLNLSSGSMLQNRALITKIYFPRLAIPVAGTLAGLPDFAISFLIFIGMLFYFGVTPGLAVVALPLLIILALATSLSVGLWLAPLNAMFRDVHHLLGFLAQIWLYATPVAYSSSLVPEQWQWLYSLNPMTGVVDGFRWATLGTQMSLGPEILVSVGVVIVLLVGGLFFFRRIEGTFVDLV